MIPYIALFCVVIIGALFFYSVAGQATDQYRGVERRRHDDRIGVTVRPKTTNANSSDVEVTQRRRFFSHKKIVSRAQFHVRRSSRFSAGDYESKNVPLFLFLTRLHALFFRERLSIGSPHSGNHKLRYCLFVGIVLISLCGLRAVCVGFTDNVIYAQSFYRGSNLTSHDVVDNILHPENYEYQDGRDFTFYIMSSFLGKVFPHHQYFFYICAILSLSGYIWLIYRYSTIPVISFLLLIALGTFTFSMTGIRQAIALGVSCFSYKYLTERKLFPFVLIVFIASLFHKSALVFIPAYWLYSIEINKRALLYFLLGFIFVIAFSPIVNKLFLTFASFDPRIGSYVEGSTTKLTAWGFIIRFVVFIFCCLGLKDLKKKSDVRFLGLFPILSVSVLGLLYDVVLFSIFFRLVMYYSLYELILVPRVISCFENQYLRLGLTVAIGSVCLFYFFQGLTDTVFYPYLFFWEDYESLYFKKLMGF